MTHHHPALAVTVAALGAFCTACTTLGPMPVATGISPVPADRTEAEAQFGGMPGYYLSSGASDDPSGSTLTQGSLLFQPGSLIGVRGLFVGGRAVGPDHDVQLEPMLGYRRAIDGRRMLSLVGVVHGTRARTRHDDAFYKASRIGAELGADLRLGSANRFLEPHLVATVSATGMWAEGEYCVDGDRQYAVDCSDDPASQIRIDASASGLYPAVTSGVALHAFGHRRSIFHGARVLVLLAAGRMPRVIGGEQDSGVGFVSGGLAVSVAFGVR